MTFDQIKRATAKRMGVTVEQLEMHNRKKRFVHPRHLAMMIARDETGASYDSIGAAFGGRDHSTVSHACTNMGYLCAFPPPGQDFAADRDAIIADALSMNKRRKRWAFSTSRDKSLIASH